MILGQLRMGACQAKNAPRRTESWPKDPIIGIASRNGIGDTKCFQKRMSLNGKLSNVFISSSTFPLCYSATTYTWHPARLYWRYCGLTATWSRRSIMWSRRRRPEEVDSTFQVDSTEGGRFSSGCLLSHLLPPLGQVEQQDKDGDHGQTADPPALYHDCCFHRR